MAADSIEELELEAMKMDDCSWHPCQVYFSPNGASLVIEFENNGFQDMLVSEKEALTRIRVRSVPLQDDDCTRVKPGDHIVVKQNSESETGLFDAEVEKVVKVRHSKRALCRCSFIIKWLHRDLDSGSLTVPSSSVSRLANKNIKNHPTISAFIDAVSAEPNVVNDFDLDLDDLLEKQIEGIRNSVDGSKKRFRDEIFGLEDEQVKQMDKETETRVPTVSPLNPFAARAALASLMMSKFPESSEISTETELCKITKISLETEAGPKAVKKSKKSLFTTTSLSEVSEISSTVVVNKRGKGDNKANKMVPELQTRLTRARVQNNSERSTRVEDKKPSSVTNRRLTRSVLDKEGENIAIEPTTEGTKTSSNPSRLTRSVLDEKKENVAIEPATEGTKTTSNVRRLTRSVLDKEGETLAIEPTTEGPKTASNARRLTQSVLHKDEQNLPIEPTTEGTKTSSNVKRITRSVVHHQAANTDTEPTKELGADVLPTGKTTKRRNADGDVTSNAGSSYGSKKKSLDLNKQLRSSPRFNPKS